MTQAFDIEKLTGYVRQAIRDVFQTMLEMNVQPGDPRLVTEALAIPNQGILALIGFAGAWVGTGSISCSAELACLACGRMLMSEHQAMDEDVLDAMAEITNMVLGNIKTTLEEDVGPLGLRVPIVVFGPNFYTRSLRRQKWSVVPFTFGEERLEVRVCLVRNDAGGVSGRGAHLRQFGAYV